MRESTEKKDYNDKLHSLPASYVRFPWIPVVVSLAIAVSLCVCLCLAFYSGYFSELA